MNVGMNLNLIEDILAKGERIANTRYHRKMYHNRGYFNYTKFNNKNVAEKNSKLFKATMYNINYNATNIKKKREFSPIAKKEVYTPL